MRYWLLSLAIVVGIGITLATTFVSGQGKDKKEPPKDKKEPFKDKKEPPKDKKEIPKELPTSPDFKEPDEVLGKGFEYWRKKIHSVDPSEREIAMKNILFFGAEKSYEAVPDIIFELARHKGNVVIDLSMRVNGIQALSTIFRYKKNPDPKYIDEAYAIYKPALSDTQVVLRMQTMKALPYLGPKSRDSFDTVLTKLAKDPVSWEIRKEAIPVLVAMALPDVPGGKTNPLTAAALGHCKLRSSPLNENSHLVRQAAIQGIVMLGERVPPELVKGLEDPSQQVRLTTLQCFAGMSQKWEASTKAGDGGTGASDKTFAVGKLNDYIDREKDAALKIWAHAVIMTIHKKITPKHLNPILEGLTHKDTPIRLLTLQIVSMAGPDTKPLAIDVVKSAVRDGDVTVGVAAVRTLVAIHALETKPMLKALYDDEKTNPTLHFAVAEALDAIEGYEKEKEKKDKEKKDKKSDDKK